MRTGLKPAWRVLCAKAWAVVSWVPAIPHGPAIACAPRNLSFFELSPVFWTGLMSVTHPYGMGAQPTMPKPYPARPSKTRS